MAEVGVTFENEGQLLHGMLHIPDHGTRHACVIFLHDYTSNRIGDHCIFVKAARYLCERGFVCLRFDFRGSGESEGDFAEMTLDSEISDALAAIDLVRNSDDFDVSAIGLLGQSLGGSVALCVAGDAQVSSLALWAPTIFVDYLVERGGEVVKDPYAWLPQTYQEALKKVGKIDIGGFLRGRAFFESLKRIDPLESLARYNGPVLVIHGGEDSVVSPLNSELIYDNVIGRRRLVLIDDADHTFSSTVWEKQVIEETYQWLAQTLNV